MKKHEMHFRAHWNKPAWLKRQTKNADTDTDHNSLSEKINSGIPAIIFMAKSVEQMWPESPLPLLKKGD